jgi:hypothetical protein
MPVAVAAHAGILNVGQGHGGQLMLAVERGAVARGRRYAVLSTFNFPARGFCEEPGYKVFAELDEAVGPHRWYFLRKIFPR